MCLRLPAPTYRKEDIISYWDNGNQYILREEYIMNILMFGPNGSGKGTQGAILQEQEGNIAHIESGAIFRKNIGGGTELGMKAKEYIDRGDLVPDDITIPMILDRLKEDDCKSGWILDGFPRNKVQAETLAKALKDEGIKLDYVVEIVLPREVAKLRITGRRLCANDNNHPNHIAFDAMCSIIIKHIIFCKWRRIN